MSINHAQVKSDQSRHFSLLSYDTPNKGYTMIFLIGGESHTGKTLLAQTLLEHFHYPYMSLDHLKMGLVKGLTPPPFGVEEDSKIASFLWGITEGVIHTCIENKQHLIIEGIYLQPKRVRILLDSMPHSPIKVLFLLFSKRYVAQHYDLILSEENAIEQRLHAWRGNQEIMTQENESLKKQCEVYGLPFLEIHSCYRQEIRQALRHFEASPQTPSNP